MGKHTESNFKKRSKLKFIPAVLHFLDDMQIDTAEIEMK
jgi:hypothetical protein